MKYSIQTLNKISKAGTDRFCDAYTISDDAKDPDAILVRSASLHDTSFGDNLKAIARAGAGVNNIPLDRCSEAGICVFNTPGANANAVKELVLTGLLISSRKIPEAMAWAATLKDGETSVAKQVEKGKSQFAGPEIKARHWALSVWVPLVHWCKCRCGTGHEGRWYRPVPVRWCCTASGSVGNGRKDTGRRIRCRRLSDHSRTVQQGHRGHD